MEDAEQEADNGFDLAVLQAIAERWPGHFVTGYALIVTAVDEEDEPVLLATTLEGVTITNELGMIEAAAIRCRETLAGQWRDE